MYYYRHIVLYRNTRKYLSSTFNKTTKYTILLILCELKIYKYTFMYLY